jgi:hypothetical protein
MAFHKEIKEMEKRKKLRRSGQKCWCVYSVGEKMCSEYNRK